MRRVLIVSPHFPPANAPDMQRVRMSLPFYRSLGWEPVILCVAAADAGTVQEPELLATFPGDIETHSCRAWSRQWTKFLGIGTLGLRGWVPLYLAGRKVLRESQIDLVFLSNTQFATFAAARIWQQEFGVPYIFDLQDPWRTDHYQTVGSRRPPGGRKYLFARAVAWALEEFSFSGASAMMSVSGDYITALHQRYAWSARLRSSVVGFGVSASDLAAAQTISSADTQLKDAGERLVHLVNTGAAGPTMPHALDVLFEALRRFRSADPALASRLRLHFIGTSYVAKGAGANIVLPVARRFGLEDLVREVPHRIGHLESLAAQARADGLLLLGSSDPAYSPSKLYPYFLSRRPVLAVMFEESQLQSVLRRTGGAFEAIIGLNEETNRAVAAIEAFFRLALKGFPPAQLPTRSEDYFNANYLTERLVPQQVDLFDACLRSPASQMRPTL